jgi:hypothetical protein
MECINKPIYKLKIKVITTFEISSGLVTGVCEIKKHIIHTFTNQGGNDIKIQQTNKEDYFRPICYNCFGQVKIIVIFLFK